MITNDGFVRIDITPEMYERALAKAEDIGKLRNSIRGGKGNLVGCLGEEVARAALNLLGYQAEEQNTYEQDIRIVGVGTAEVKTKDRTVEPCLEYDASVADYNTRQSADMYIFVSVTRDKASGRYTHGFVTGLIEKPEYLKRARFLEKGTIDPSNGWVVSADCYNLSYRELARFGG